MYLDKMYRTTLIDCIYLSDSILPNKLYERHRHSISAADTDEHREWASIRELYEKTKTVIENRSRKWI